jgi:NAD-dependent deacetylase
MDNVERLKQIINNDSAKIVFLGGAGVSTESGIPDFRSKDGLYKQKYKYTPEYMLSRSCLYNNPKDFYEFYKDKMDCRRYEPNIVHKKLAELEKQGKLIGIVTQNIDGLHQKAGSKNVIEIHGTTKRNYCTKCGQEYSEDYIFEYNGLIPRCTNEKCKQVGMIRPDVVLYDEQVKDWKKASNLIGEANVLIIGGTSLSVYPACNLIYDFQGEHIIIINKGEITLPMLNPDSDFVIDDYLGNVFSKL